VPLLLLLYDSSAFLTLLLSILPLAVIVYSTHLLFPQCCYNNSIYFLVFLGTIYYTNYWRPVGSSLFSIVFCQLLQCFYYFSLSFLPLLTVFGHIAPLSIHIAYYISFSFSINIHCIGISS